MTDILCIFQNIPLPPPDDFLQKLKKLIIGYIWKNNQARIRLSHLAYSKGGVKCPDMTWYYWAVQFRSIKHFTPGSAEAVLKI